jgi:uncharacterized protein GlcG (DUF336 family)
MTSVNRFAAAAALTLLTATSALAQQTTPAPAAAPAATAPMPYGPPITLDAAKKVMEAAEAEAAKNNWPVVITIVDSGGHIVMVHRRDNTQIGSLRIAEGKARTSVELRRPTKALEDALAAGGAGVRFLAVEGVMPLEGGIVIQSDGKIIGGIGVSGVMSSQDAQVARAGAAAVGM